MAQPSPRGGWRRTETAGFGAGRAASPPPRVPCRRAGPGLGLGHSVFHWSWLSSPLRPREDAPTVPGTQRPLGLPGPGTLNPPPQNSERRACSGQFPSPATISPAAEELLARRTSAPQTLSPGPSGPRETPRRARPGRTLGGGRGPRPGPAGTVRNGDPSALRLLADVGVHQSGPAAVLRMRRSGLGLGAPRGQGVGAPRESAGTPGRVLGVALRSAGSPGPGERALRALRPPQSGLKSIFHSTAPKSPRSCPVGRDGGVERGGGEPQHPAAFRVPGSRDGARRRRPEASAQGILAEPSVESARVSFAGLSGSLWPSGQVFPLSHLSRAFYVPSLLPPCSSTPTFHLFLPSCRILDPGKGEAPVTWGRGPKWPHH